MGRADSSSCDGVLCLEGPRRMQDWRLAPDFYGWDVWVVGIGRERCSPAGGSVLFGNIARSGDESGGAG